MSTVKPFFTTDDKGLLTKLAESVGLTAKDIGKTLDIPTIGDVIRTGEGAVKTVHDDIMLIYKDGEENVSQIGVEIADTKNQLISTFQYTLTLLFVILGTGVLLYGNDIFSVFLALYERVKANGVSFNFAL